MENIEVQKISNEIHSKAGNHNFLQEYTTKLDNINIVDFFSYNTSKFSDIYLQKLFLEGREYLFKLSLDELITILKSVEEKEQQFIFFLSFFCKYIEVDLAYNYNLVHELTPKLEETLKLKSSLFEYSRIDDLQLAHHNIEKQTFMDFKQKLIAAGSKEKAPKRIIHESMNDWKYNAKKKGYYKS